MEDVVKSSEDRSVVTYACFNIANEDVVIQSGACLEISSNITILEDLSNLSL